MLSAKQQAFDILTKSENILIIPTKDASTDSIGCALALLAVCRQAGKKADIACQDAGAKNFFLPNFAEIKKEPASLREFIISVNTSDNQIKQLRYETGEKELKIFLASHGRLEQKDIRLQPGPFLYDLIVCVGAPDMESLGENYERFPELFLEKPILNIDHHSGNEHFGEINLVEPTASSSSEIAADLFHSFFGEQMTVPAATCLLAGLIEETQSFQKATATPQTFNLASWLIAQGAEKEMVIKELYKTKPINRLRLWGVLLGGLEWTKEKNIAMLEAKTEDFEKTQTSPKDLLYILDEIRDLLPLLSASFIFYPEESGLISILAHSPRPEILQRLNLELGGAVKNSRALFKLACASSKEAKARILGLLTPLL